MKKTYLLLLLFAPFILFAQDDVKLIEPIVESPAMSPVKARSFSASVNFRNWGIQKLGLDTIMAGYTGKGQKVCICDTGKPDHYALIRQTRESKNFTSDDSVNDGNGHSTHVAGIITEIAPDAELYFAKVLSNSGSGSNTGVAQGIEWCIEQQADIINMSLGGSSPSPIIKRAIDKAVEDSIIIIAAAGNSGQSETDNRMGYPARYEETIAIGSINDRLRVSSFSSSGDEGDLVAPGERILSTWKNGNYIVLSGTSMATPFVAGTAALFLEKYGNIQGVESIFESKSTDMIPAGFDRYSFWGHINPTNLFSHEFTNPPDTSIIEPEPGPKPPEIPTWIGKNWIAVLIVVIFVGAVIYGIVKIKSKDLYQP